MTIKIGGTTVFSSSRVLQNLGTSSVASTVTDTVGGGEYERYNTSKLEVHGGKLRLNMVRTMSNCDALTSNCNCNCNTNCNCNCRC
ncbi:MAG: hypothetical protein JJ979_17300 [Roseibium sp.]|nr:hypothetical protein [Roseibium sp.]